MDFRIQNTKFVFQIIEFIIQCILDSIIFLESGIHCIPNSIIQNTNHNLYFWL